MSQAERGQSEELKLAEAAGSLHEELAELEHLYRTAPVGLCFLDTELRYVRINEQLAAINGKPVSAHIGRPFQQILPELAPTLEPMFQQILQAGEPVLNLEISGNTPAEPEVERDWLCSYYPVKSDEGVALGITAVVQDISERKRTEQALRKAQEELEGRVRERTEELRENEKRLRRLLESTSAVPWMADPSTWLFTYVGPRAVDILGYPLAQWYEKDFWATHVHPDDREAAIDFCAKSSLSLAEYEFEYRMIAADGSIVWMHDLVSVEHANGKPRTLRGFMIDVTERKQLEEEFHRHQAALAHVTRVSTLGELAASVSHELNQPLTAIVSNAQASLRLLSHETPDLEDVRGALKEITDCGKRAGQVIQRLRGLLKKGESQRDPLDINEVIRDVVSLYKSDALIKDVSVEFDLALDLPRVLGDHIQLQQVVLNFLVNASDAIEDLEPGSRKVVVGTSRADSTTIEVKVRDFGTGLDPVYMDRIFDAFFTTKPDGMGMGLSISRSIVEAHGGRLWATQNTDRGATFHFTLPVSNGASL